MQLGLPYLSNASDDYTYITFFEIKIFWILLIRHDVMNQNTATRKFFRIYSSKFSSRISFFLPVLLADRLITIRCVFQQNCSRGTYGLEVRLIVFRFLAGSKNLYLLQIAPTLFRAPTNLPFSGPATTFLRFKASGP
jgi:hypothetical protein